MESSAFLARCDFFPFPLHKSVYVLNYMHKLQLIVFYNVSICLLKCCLQEENINSVNIFNG